MARRKIRSPKHLERLWAEYKEYCNNQKVIRTEFSQRTGEFHTAEVPKSITITIKGFCVWLGLARSAFYKTYEEDDKEGLYKDVLQRMRDDCEIDARRKFELEAIPSKLAPLWMSHYGYSTKAEEKTEITVPVFQGEDDLED